MNRKRQMPLLRKVTLAIVLSGLVPALIIGSLAIFTARKTTAETGRKFAMIAESAGDKVDRNLFERYGDVQAFGANEAVNDLKSWHQVGSDKNKIAAAANRYAALYGFYLLSYVVDLEGRVVAVNDKDPAGRSIDTKAFYQKSFKDAEWFKETLAGHFMKSELLDGTYVQDLHVDEDVKAIYGSDGLVLGFSAPVKNAEGKIVAVWHNCANFSLVEEIIANVYDDLKTMGDSHAKLSLVDHTGRVLMDYSPAANGNNAAVVHNSQVILKQNLAQEGNEAAVAVSAGRNGFGIFSYGNEPAEMTGYAVCDGELGFPGLKWGVLVRVPKSEALAEMTHQLYSIIGIIVASIAGLIGIGMWLGRSISLPLVNGIHSMRDISVQVTTSTAQMSATSQTVAEAASEQAASLEETSSSLEEISSMTKRNAQNASNGKNLSQEATTSANAGLEKLGEMGRTLGSIKVAVSDMEQAVKEMQGSSQEIAKIIKTIDEIAFQTNLLALNAAVEAARAGEAGAGFAVVADEVRALAQRSAQAARDTSEKIEAAIKRSELGGVASAKVVKNLAEVEDNAHKLGQVFNGIVTQVKSLDTVISEIAAASEEQNVGITEVNMAVGQMDKVTQGNAASAEENASAAEALVAQIGALKQVITGFETVVSGIATDARASISAPVSKKAAGKTAPSSSAIAVNSRPVAAGSTQNHAEIPMPEPTVARQARGTFQDF